MTAHSLRILEFPEPASADELGSASLSVPTAQGLNAFADRFGPYDLSAWAEPRGHALYYVDNCWVRARVRGRDLPDFFRDALKGGPELSPGIEASREYLIEVEEY